jgi:hypothetical protein
MAGLYTCAALALLQDEAGERLDSADEDTESPSVVNGGGRT